MLLSLIGEVIPLEILFGLEDSSSEDYTGVTFCEQVVEARFSHLVFDSPAYLSRTLQECTLTYVCAAMFFEVLR